MIPKGIFQEKYSGLKLGISTFLLLIICGFITPKSAAQGITVEGTVILERAQNPAVATNLGGYQNVPQVKGSENESSSKSIIIWLEAKNNKVMSPKESLGQDMPVLNQRDKHFKPRLMVIEAGDTVRIRNSDPVYHNVFSLSKTKRFDVGRRSPGDYQDVKFNEPGKVDVFCDIHSDMHAVIMVASKQTVAMTKLKTEGKFQFTNIPEGDYTVHLYALGDRSKTIDIRVTDTEKVVLPTIRLGS